MKRSFRLGLVGLAVLAGSLFGVTQFSGTANAQIAAITKACTAAAGNTANCTINFPAPGIALVAGQSFTVSLTAPFLTGTFNAATPVATVGAPATVINAGNTSYTVTCAAACTITSINEVVGNAPAGTTIAQSLTLNGPGNTQVGAAAVAPGAFALPTVTLVAPGTTTAGGVLPVGTTKTCSTAVPAPGSTFTCTITVPANVASPVTVTVANATVTAATVAPAAVGVVTGAAGTNTFTVTAPAPATVFASAFTITETLVAGAGLGTTVTETLSAGGVGFPAVTLTPTNAPITITAAGAAFVTSINLAGCVAAATIGAPAVGGTVIPAGTTTVTNINAGQTITCRINLDDNESAAVALTGSTGSTVASGIVAVTTSTPTAAGTLVTVTPNVGGIISQTGNTTTVRCGAAPAGANTTNGCDFVDVTFTAAQTLNAVAGLPLQVILNVTYTPDIPAQDTSAQGQFNAFTIGIGVSAFVQPTGFLFTCPSALNPNLTTTANSAFLNVFNGLPGQLGGVNVAGVGILPAALICQVIPTVGGVTVGSTATVTGVAPGTIEVSSVNGTLLDANGNITTNLRIACGGTTSNFSTSGIVSPTSLGAVINPNSCTGVNFAVLGLGVGYVEIRARYEPTATAEVAGIVEIEGASSVAFIAPPVTLSLVLNPATVTAFNAGGTVVAGGTDPSGLQTLAGAPCVVAAAGATAPAATSCGVATLTFLGSVITFNGGGTTGTQIFVNPTNGTFLRNPNGSILNGNVIFSSSDDSIARFVTPGTTSGTFTVAGAASTVGTSTGNQVVVRCGTPFNATTGVNPGVGSNFGTFFGGCNTASATYQGVNPGQANVTATFIPDLPGAFGTLGSGLAGFTTSTNAIGANVFNLLNGFQALGGTGNVSASATLTVTAPTAAATTSISLVRGCNNVSPTVSESATAYAARVSAASALVSIFEYQPATNTFRGFSPLPGAPSDLASVTRLRPVFVCVNAAATLAQPTI